MDAVTRLETQNSSAGRLPDHLSDQNNQIVQSSCPSTSHNHPFRGKTKSVTLPPDLESEPNQSIQFDSNLQQHLLISPRLKQTSESSEQSVLWDDYCEKSSYELGEESFWSANRDSRKIPIVSTDISELGFTSSEGESDSSQGIKNNTVTMATPSNECNVAAKALASAKSVLQVRIEMLDPDDVDASFAHTVPEELNGIRDLLGDYILKVRSFLQDFQGELEPSTVSLWEDELKKTKKLVLDHKKSVWEKYNQIHPVKPISYFEQQRKLG